MTILEMIAEWRRGCSDASSDHPEGCKQCTVGLINAIENKLMKDPVPRIYEIIGNGNTTISADEIRGLLS